MLGTLNTALTEEILVTIIVILVSVFHLRSSLLISSLLPIAVLMCFIGMKTFGVDANIVALSGIAIAIGTMVDMGIILCENILKKLDEAGPDEDRGEVIFRATSEVASAILTAVSTTVISFLPVFTMIGAEGKLFRPLAFTKTFALIASVIVALAIIPPVAHILFANRKGSKKFSKIRYWLLIITGLIITLPMNSIPWWCGIILAGTGVFKLFETRMSAKVKKLGPMFANSIAILVVGVLLTTHWLPLGPEKGMIRNILFVFLLLGGLLAFFQIFQIYFYKPILRWCLANKLLFLSLPAVVVMVGASAWLGFDKLFSFMPAAVRNTSSWKMAATTFPGLGKEFMPPLDEGSYLYMPTTMPHASIGEVMDVMQLQDTLLMSIPEVESAVGKLGRVESPLDPAPISMIETIITYKSEYTTDKNGHRMKFRYDKKKKEFLRNENGTLIEDPAGLGFTTFIELDGCGVAVHHGLEFGPASP